MTTNKKLEYHRKWELLRQRDSSGCINREDLMQQPRNQKWVGYIMYLATNEGWLSSSIFIRDK